MIIKYKTTDIPKELYRDIQSSKRNLYEELYNRSSKMTTISTLIADSMSSALSNNAVFYSFKDNTIVPNEDIVEMVDSIQSLYLLYNFFDATNLILGELVVCIDDKYYTKYYNLLSLFGTYIAEDLRDEAIDIILEENDDDHLKEFYSSDYDDSTYQYHILLDAFNNGNIEALVDIGRSYESECGVPRDADEAMRCYKEACGRGSKQAAYYIALLYSNGETSEGVNKKEAFKYALYGTIRGNSKATNLLGNFYKRGEIVEKDEEMSFNIFNQGCMAGLIDCEMSLAIAYHFGIGVKQDIKKAISMYSELLNVFPLANYNLACIYANYKEYGIEKASPFTVYYLLKEAYMGGYNKQDILNEINLYLEVLHEDNDLLIAGGFKELKRRIEENLKCSVQ